MKYTLAAIKCPIFWKNGQWLPASSEDRINSSYDLASLASVKRDEFTQVGLDNIVNKTLDLVTFDIDSLEGHNRLISVAETLDSPILISGSDYPNSYHCHFNHCGKFIKSLGLFTKPEDFEIISRFVVVEGKYVATHGVETDLILPKQYCLKPKKGEVSSKIYTQGLLEKGVYRQITFKEFDDMLTKKPMKMPYSFLNLFNMSESPVNVDAFSFALKRLLKHLDCTSPSKGNREIWRDIIWASEDAFLYELEYSKKSVVWDTVVKLLADWSTVGRYDGSKTVITQLNEQPHNRDKKSFTFKSEKYVALERTNVKVKVREETKEVAVVVEPPAKVIEELVSLRSLIELDKTQTGLSCIACTPMLMQGFTTRKGVYMFNSPFSSFRECYLYFASNACAELANYYPFKCDREVYEAYTNPKLLNSHFRSVFDFMAAISIVMQAEIDRSSDKAVIISYLKMFVALMKICDTDADFGWGRVLGIRNAHVKPISLPQISPTKEDVIEYVFNMIYDDSTVREGVSRHYMSQSFKAIFVIGMLSFIYEGDLKKQLDKHGITTQVLMLSGANGLGKTPFVESFQRADFGYGSIGSLNRVSYVDYAGSNATPFEDFKQSFISFADEDSLDYYGKDAATFKRLITDRQISYTIKFERGVQTMPIKGVLVYASNKDKGQIHYDPAVVKRVLEIHFQKLSQEDIEWWGSGGGVNEFISKVYEEAKYIVDTDFTDLNYIEYSDLARNSYISANVDSTVEVSVNSYLDEFINTPQDAYGGKEMYEKIGCINLHTLTNFIVSKRGSNLHKLNIKLLTSIVKKNGFKYLPVASYGKIDRSKRWLSDYEVIYHRDALVSNYTTVANLEKDLTVIISGLLNDWLKVTKDFSNDNMFVISKFRQHVIERVKSPKYAEYLKLNNFREFCVTNLKCTFRGRQYTTKQERVIALEVSK